MKFEMWVPIKPIAKGRPRLSGNHTFTPKRTREFEEELRFSFELEVNNQKWICDDSPIDADIRFYFAHKKKTGLHTCRPDLDNLFKAVADAGNGILYNDDSQIYHASISKRYADIGVEGINIILWKGSL